MIKVTHEDDHPPQTSDWRGGLRASLPPRRRRWALCAALLTLTMTSWGQRAELEAQELPPVNIQQFRLAPGPADYLTVYGTGLTPDMGWTAGFFLNLADGPLRERGASSEDTEVVDFQLGGDLIATFGLFDRLELGAALPLVLAQASDDLTPVAGADFNGDLQGLAVGDLRLNAKYEFLNLLDGVGLSGVLVVYAPTGNAEAFTGDGNIGAEGRVASDVIIYKGIRAGGNLGFRYRPKGRLIRDAFVGNEVVWGAGIVLPLFTEKLDALAELNGAIPVGAGPLDQPNAGSFPGEALLAVRYAVTQEWTITVGGGRRFTAGYGSPNSRVFIGLGHQWVTGGVYQWDYDNDGFIGARDQCPRESEDLDGFLDTDGCPDFDNDGDGVPDTQDACPDAGGSDLAEVNPDGCPDDDIDGDFIPNDRDECPEDPEDIDKHEDSDGCPDLDNDQDGILDVRDGCPDTPETVNGIVDTDGCPETEGQTVIVTDSRLEILQQVYFDTGRATIKKESFDILDAVVQVLRDNRDITLLQIQGHTDDRGNDAANLKLSQRRAAAVQEYLVEQGVSDDRLTNVGYGETSPIDSNDTREGRSRNRRVEFIILKRGQPNSPLRGGEDDAESGDPFDLDGGDPF